MYACLCTLAHCQFCHCEGHEKEGKEETAEREGKRRDWSTESKAWGKGPQGSGEKDKQDQEKEQKRQEKEKKDQLKKEQRKSNQVYRGKWFSENSKLLLPYMRMLSMFVWGNLPTIVSMIHVYLSPYWSLLLKIAPLKFHLFDPLFFTSGVSSGQPVCPPKSRFEQVSHMCSKPRSLGVCQIGVICDV